MIILLTRAASIGLDPNNQSNPSNQSKSNKTQPNKLQLLEFSIYYGVAIILILSEQ